ncbi:uncharacterized protein N7479_002216 [Penicillium vulpinum]|uniref:uncharacterized protein n=1 Tax=Penicillium vulpinum TaxID=29845 RepID=UPI002547635D|nr:uncharacterized protein N7479_002216 [Penicillium vulpinum]KAJ5972298.1 hypothetical protein N7479_002216 [Penicillium vulpinum]
MTQLRAELSAEFASTIQALQSEILTLLQQSTFRQQVQVQFQPGSRLPSSSHRNNRNPTCRFRHPQHVAVCTPYDK